MNTFKTKDAGLEISVKDVDTEGRTVSGYFASFGNIDSDGDVFQKGAFAKTIQENKERIRHLLQHDVGKPLGKPIELKEDNTGLYFQTPISNTTFGNDTLELYKDGVYNEHSVGFMTINEHPTQDEDGNEFNLITEVKLMEGSTVTWGANSQTPTTGIKDWDLSLDQSKKIVDYVQNIEKLLKKGSSKITNETFRNLEIELAKLKALLPNKDSQEPQKSDLERFYDALLNKNN